MARRFEDQIAGDIGSVLGILLAGLFAGAVALVQHFTPKPRLTIPLAARFEHTHIVGGSGHGKTQLLQHLIATEELPAVAAGKRTLIVIDSQGDMLSKILHLAQFSPHLRGLSERLIYLDPGDTELPPALNLFDFGSRRLKSYSAIERERMQNGTIALYEYLFGALLGAELTARQETLFRFLAQLLMVVPGATIYTLIDFMEKPERIEPYLDRLEGPAEQFLTTQFFSSAYEGTRRQITDRLFMVLSNNALSRMFLHRESKLDLFRSMNRGSVILINTAKDVLKEEYCTIFGRFMIALIAQATQERAAIPQHKRLPTLVYIDEAQDYFDKGMETLVSQGRKYNVGLILAHQNLGQFPRDLQKSVMTSTAIKYAGGVSKGDAVDLAGEMNCSWEFIKAMVKGGDETQFALFAKNITPVAQLLSVPFGTLEGLPRLSQKEFEILLTDNRERYCAPVDRSLLRGSHPGRQAAFHLGNPQTI